MDCARPMNPERRCSHLGLPQQLLRLLEQLTALVDGPERLTEHSAQALFVTVNSHHSNFIYEEWPHLNRVKLVGIDLIGEQTRYDGVFSGWVLAERCFC